MAAVTGLDRQVVDQTAPAVVSGQHGTDESAARKGHLTRARIAAQVSGEFRRAVAFGQLDALGV